MDRVIEALPTLLSQHPGLHYLLVGEGPYRAELGRLIAERQLSAHVTFAGLVSDAALAEHYAIADLFIMPHRQLSSGDTEGFGVVFLEANACGLPVIAGMAGGASDAVQHEKNGLIVDGDDIGAIARAVTRILEDKELRARLRAGGLARARDADFRERAKQFLAVCQRVTHQTA
jgi:phosphatidylinositol alpha-1,6-mannosyltransferase